MLTKTKEYVPEQDREAFHISADMHGHMGFHISSNGSVQCLSMKMVDIDSKTGTTKGCVSSFWATHKLKKF